MCQCPLGLITHFYFSHLCVIQYLQQGVNALSAYNSFLHMIRYAEYLYDCEEVSMPSRAYNSFLQYMHYTTSSDCKWCQCPLGLITHFYATPSKTLVLCGFQNLFLQVFVRIFWQQPFFVHVNNLDIFSRCSAFKYVFLVYHRKCKLSSYFFTLYYKNRTFHYYLFLSIASYIYKRFFAITDMLP